jgi:2,3-bisphosphoglycerate-independent phosphoglycerate mutase
MKNKYKILLSIVSLLVIAISSYFWATGSISSNYSYRSVLKDNPPNVGENLGDPATGRVIIVLIDGLRYDTSLNSKIMPYLNELRANGSSAKMHSEAPSYSEPGYSTILTGAWPELNDGPALNLDYEEIPTFTQDDLFTAVHDKGLRTAISGYYWFEKLMPQSSVDFSFYTPGEDAKADNEVVEAATPFLQNSSIKLVLVHIDQVDYAGHHQGGPQSPNWDSAAKTSDNLLLFIANQIDLEKDTLVVFSDHGHIMAGGHGGQDPDILTEPFVIAGAGVKKGVETEINMVDIAPTLAALLGARLPASTQGQARTDLVELSQSVSANLPSAVEAQQSQLVLTYAKLMGKPIEKSALEFGDDVAAYQAVINKIHDSRLLVQRVLRAIPAAVLLAGAIILLVRRQKTGAIAWVVGAVVYVILFNFRYAVLSKKTYSLSSVTGQMDLILYTAITAAVAFLIAFLVDVLMNKTLAKKPATAALDIFGLGLTTVFVLALPVILSFVLNGVLVTWTLPDYLTSFISLLSLIQILVVSVVTLLFVFIITLLTLRNKTKRVHSK